MVCYKMDKWLMCVVALILGMLMFHMLKNVCGCRTVEGYGGNSEVIHTEFNKINNQIDLDSIKALSDEDIEKAYYTDTDTDTDTDTYPYQCGNNPSVNDCSSLHLPVFTGTCGDYWYPGKPVGVIVPGKKYSPYKCGKSKKGFSCTNEKATCCTGEVGDLCDMSMDECCDGLSCKKAPSPSGKQSPISTCQPS